MLLEIANHLVGDLSFLNVFRYITFRTGGAMLTWWIVPIMLSVGFVTPWPYNYWRLKKYNQACH